MFFSKKETAELKLKKTLEKIEKTSQKKIIVEYHSSRYFLNTLYAWFVVSIAFGWIFSIFIHLPGFILHMYSAYESRLKDSYEIFCNSMMTAILISPIVFWVFYNKVIKYIIVRSTFHSIAITLFVVLIITPASISISLFPIELAALKHRADYRLIAIQLFGWAGGVLISIAVLAFSIFFIVVILKNARRVKNV